MLSSTTSARHIHSRYSGFASLDVEMICEISKEGLQHDFIDFAPYIGKCRFNDCAHLKEPGCAVTAAVAAGR